MELYLIRHGQSKNNALMEDQVLRDKDPELTETGKEQAKLTAQYLATGVNREQLVRYALDMPERQQHHGFNITHLYCSAMYRALQTAQPIAAALGLKPEVWLDIHEHGGIYLHQDGVVTGYGGRGRSQIQSEFLDYVLPDKLTDEGWWNPSEGEESLAKAQGRAIEVAAVLRRRALDPMTAQDRIALVTHGTFLDALIKALFNQLPGNGFYHTHYNTAISRIDLFPNEETRIRYLNRVDHLPVHLLTS